jgi:muramidase (phage lysozyme)
MVAKATGDTVNRLGATMGQIGTFESTFGSFSGAIKLGAMSQQNIQKQYTAILEDQKKQGVTGGKANDALLEDRAKLIKAQQDANRAMEEFVFKGVQPAQTEMIKLAKATGAAADGLTKMFGGNSQATGGEQSGAFTEEEATAAQPMLAKAQQERDIYASDEFKKWQEEQGANFMQKGMYHEKYGVGAYMKEKGIPTAPTEPVERATGSLGKTGSLIEDFGKGTPAILHGKEGVITEDQLRKFGEQAMDIGGQMAAPLPALRDTTAVLGQPSDKLKELVNGTTEALNEQLEVEEKTLELKKEQQDIAEDQVKLREKSAKREKAYADEDLKEYKKYVDRKDKLYTNILDAIESQFKIIQQTTGGMSTAVGSAQSSGQSPAGAAIASYFGGTGGGAMSGGGGAMSGGGGGGGSSNAGVLGGGSGMGGELFMGGPPQPGVIGKLLDYIGKHESGGNYNILVGGKTNPDLSNMTIGEVLQFQKQMRAQGHESTAVGKYQIINSTLSSLVKQGFANLDDKFDPSTQDKLAVGLLKRRGLDDYMAGKLDANTFADKLSMEWASLPYHTGASYYAGVGSNAAGEGRDKFMSSVFAKDGGMFSGPISGYPATLHGDEAVIPLKDGNVPAEIPRMETLVEQNEAVKTEIITMREEMKQMLTDLTAAINSSKESGVQERMVSILETIARYQSSTADASRKLVQHAAN